jgi:plasmid stability protein
MTNLTVRNIPDDVLERIRQRSQIDRRSLNNELIVVLEKGLSIEDSTNRKYPDRDLQLQIWNDLAGRWKDGRSTDEIIRDIYESRTEGRAVDL